MGLIGFHGLHANVKFLGNLAGSMAYSNQAENLKLPIRQLGDERLSSRPTAYKPVKHPLAIQSLT
jgi:hypothetical protein